jgi:hypothetical protein
MDDFTPGAIPKLREVEAVLRELSKQIIHPQENVFKKQADKIAAAIADLHVVAGFVEGVPADARPTSVWCNNLLRVSRFALQGKTSQEEKSNA